MSWEDQGRQEHGWFGHGTAPPKDGAGGSGAEPRPSDAATSAEVAGKRAYAWAKRFGPALFDLPRDRVVLEGFATALARRERARPGSIARALGLWVARGQPARAAGERAVPGEAARRGGTQFSLASSAEVAAKIDAIHRGAFGRPVSPEAKAFSRAMLALGVPMENVRATLVAAGASQRPDAQGLRNSLLGVFLGQFWNSTLVSMGRDTIQVIYDFINDPVETARRLGPSFGGFGAVAGDVPAIIQGLTDGLRLLGSTAPSSTEALEAERQRLADLIHRRELGTDPARGGQFSTREADTAIRLERVIARRLTRDAAGSADWIDAYGMTFDGVGPVPPAKFDVKSFTSAITEHLGKQGLNRVVIDMTGAHADQVAAVNDYLSTLDPAQLSRIIKLGF